jgi:26S proteasome regulatory subunit N2
LLSRQEDTTGADSADVKQVETPLVVKRGVQGQLQAIIETLFERCFSQKRYRQVVGIAVEAKNLDVLRRAILRASRDEKQQQESSRRSEELMEYVLDICMGIVQERSFRNEVSFFFVFIIYILDSMSLF